MRIQDDKSKVCKEYNLVVPTSQKIDIVPMSYKICSFIKLLGLVNDVNKMMAECLRTTKVAIFALFGQKGF